MTRSVPEWIGRTDDTMPPPLVKLRIFETHGGRCYLCTRKIMVGDAWDADHVKPIWDGGENRESNMKPACVWCHRRKTAGEASQRAEGKRHRAKQAGIKPKPRNPMNGSRDSKWKHTFRNGWVRRS